MIQVRKSEERGHFDYGWLDTRHSFSFGQYYDPDQMGFRALRVLNEDLVKPGAGFPTHSHRDMEILSFVLDGAIAHEDSMGNGSVIRAGEVQRMTAGTGVTHSEYNASQTDPLHFLQIWIAPEREGLQPGYQQKDLSQQEKRGRLLLAASRDEREGSLLVHQDVDIYTGIVQHGMERTYGLADGRHAWLQVVRGKVLLNGVELQEGDGAAVSEEHSLRIVGGETDSEILLLDLA